MRSVINIIVAIFVIVCSSISISGQNEYSWQLDAISKNAAIAFYSQDYQKAIPLIHEIVDYLNKINPVDYINIATWQNNLAQSYMNCGDYNNAEKIYLEAFEILTYNNRRNDRIFRVLLNGMSALYVQLHNYEKANEFNQTAKMLYENAADFGDDYVACLGNGALIQHALGYNTLAKMMLDVSLRQAKHNLSDTISCSSSLTSHYPMADSHAITQSTDRDSYIKTRIIPYMTLLSSSAVIYSESGYFSDAVRSIKEAIKLSDEYGFKDATLFNNLAHLYHEKSEYGKAAEWLLKSYPICKTPFEITEVGMNLIVDLFLANDERSLAYCAELSSIIRQNIRSVFAFLNSTERFNYWKHFEDYLPRINTVIYESGKTVHFGIIYDNILENKGLLLRSSNEIRDAIFNSGNESDRADYARISTLRKRLLTEADDSVRISLNKEIEELDKRLSISVSSYAAFNNAKTISWESVRDALSDNDVAIEFYDIPQMCGLDSIKSVNSIYSEPRYCAVLLKKESTHPHIVPLCKESSLYELEKVDIYETDFIYRLIWEPLRNELDGIKNIYFAADRELHKIGIEYAPMPDGQNISDKYNLYRLSSTRTLVDRKSGRVGDNAVLYGGLRYDLDKDELIAESRSGDYHPTSTSRAFADENSRYGVKYLPGTLTEVNAIAENFNSTPLLITGINGTEESFKTLACTPIDIIHLATHGFFWTYEDADKRSYVTFLQNLDNMKDEEDKALMRSGLFFSGANIGLKGEALPDDVEDGVLTAAELSNMNLGHVDMVVMSACESGLGETSGEGVFGLQRGFKLAGANTLLMSLWKVDDTATQLLMTDFYRNYLSGKSKQESLRLAQQSLRSNPEYSDPEYWAAFILLDGLN